MRTLSRGRLKWMDDQELLPGVGEPHRHRVAQLDRVGATGPVLSHHGDT
jgi:hypothetical protein